MLPARRLLRRARDRRFSTGTPASRPSRSRRTVSRLPAVIRAWRRFSFRMFLGPRPAPLGRLLRQARAKALRLLEAEDVVEPLALLAGAQPQHSARWFARVGMRYQAPEPFSMLPAGRREGPVSGFHVAAVDELRPVTAAGVEVVRDRVPDVVVLVDAAPVRVDKEVRRKGVPDCGTAVRAGRRIRPSQNASLRQQ